MSERPTADPDAERYRQRRRRLGLVMILVSIALVLAGQFALDPYLHDVSFLLYWGACTAFTVLALFAGLVDMVAVRREAAREERKLVQNALGRRVAPKEAEEGESGREQKA